MFLLKISNRTIIKLPIQATFLALSISTLLHSSDTIVAPKSCKKKQAEYFNFNQALITAQSMSPRSELKFVLAILQNISPRSLTIYSLSPLNQIRSRTTDIMASTVENSWNNENDEKECHAYHHRSPARQADVNSVLLARKKSGKRTNISPEPSPTTAYPFPRRSSLLCTPQGTVITQPSVIAQALYALRHRQPTKHPHDNPDMYYSSPTPTPKAHASQSRGSAYDAYDFAPEPPPTLTLPAQKTTQKDGDKAESTT